jgi:ribulose kinase
VLPGGGLLEFYQASGGDYGGDQVNKRFLDFIIKLFGGDVIEAVKQKHQSDWVEISNNFALTMKANKAFKDEEKVVIRFPITFGQEYQTLMETSFQERIKDLGFEGQVENKRDKLILTCDIFKTFFEFSLSGITKFIESVLKHGYNTDTIIFVGGLAESPYLIGMLRKHFCDYKVLVPEDPSLAVLHGAVMFGLHPTKIKSRKCKYTCGIAK